MAARGNMPPQAPGMMRHGPVPPLGPIPLGPPLRHPMDPLPPPELLENKLQSQGAEMDRLLMENKRLAATHATLRQELIVAQQEMQRIHVHSGRIQTENELQIRSLQEKIYKLEADVNAAESIRMEVQQAHLEAQGLFAARQELTVQILQDTEELKKLHSDLKKLPEMHAELDGLMQEHQKLRSTFEHEKGANMELVQQMHVMEKNLITMAREVEKLRAEVQNAEKKANAPNPHQSQYGTHGTPDPVNPSPAQGANQYAGGGYSQGGAYGGSAYNHYGHSAYSQGMSANYDPYGRAQSQTAGAAAVGEGTNPYAGAASAGAYDPNRGVGGYDAARAAYDGTRGAVAASGGYDAARGAVPSGYDASRGSGVYDAARGTMVPGGYDSVRGAAPTGGYDTGRAAAAAGGYDHARMASAAGGYDAARAAAAGGGYDAARMAGGGVANAYDGSRAGENMAGMYDGMRAPAGAYGMYDPARAAQQQPGPR